MFSIEPDELKNCNDVTWPVSIKLLQFLMNIFWTFVKIQFPNVVFSAMTLMEFFNSSVKEEAREFFMFKLTPVNCQCEPWKFNPSMKTVLT